MQVPFLLNEGTDEVKPVRYLADFVVWETDSKVRIIDVKPDETYRADTYKVKKRLFEARYRLKIEEVW